MDKSLREAASIVIDALVETKIKPSVKVSDKALRRLQRSIDNTFKTNEDVLDERRKGKGRGMKTVVDKDPDAGRKITVTADAVGRPKENPETRRERLRVQRRGGAHQNDTDPGRRNRRRTNQQIRSGNFEV